MIKRRKIINKFKIDQIIFNVYLKLINRPNDLNNLSKCNKEFYLVFIEFKKWWIKYYPIYNIIFNSYKKKSYLKIQYNLFDEKNKLITPYEKFNLLDSKLIIDYNLTGNVLFLMEIINVVYFKSFLLKDTDPFLYEKKSNCCRCKCVNIIEKLKLLYIKFICFNCVINNEKLEYIKYIEDLYYLYLNKKLKN